MRKIFAGMALMCVLMVSGQSVWAASAETVIKRTTERVLNNPYLLKNPNSVKAIVKDVFDFTKMSKFVLGTRWKRVKPRKPIQKNWEIMLRGESKWRKVTKDTVFSDLKSRKVTKYEQKRFVTAFRNLLIRTYSNALSEAAGMVKNIKYSSTRRRARRRARRTTVHSKVYRHNHSKPIKIDYVMYKRKRRNKWKVYNVIVEGISLVTTYRTEFGHDIRRMGINGLIRKINRKNREG